MTSTTRPLVVMDTSVVTHHVIDLTRDSKGVIKNPVTNTVRDERLKLGYQLYNTLFWFLGADPSNYDVIWVGDDKSEPYWRTIEVKKWLDSLDPDDKILTKRKGTRKGYKGNRNTCTYAQWVHKRMMVFAKPFTLPGYEADDLMAAIVKTYTDRPIILATIDSDWLQTVDERVSWCCLTGYEPAFRDVDRGLQWFQNKLTGESQKTQKAIKADSLRNIVKWKSMCGDVSDNLPPGTPEYFIDLFNPPDEHKLWLSPYFQLLAQRYIKPGVNDNGDCWENWVGKFGLPSTKDILLPPHLLR